MSEVEFVLVHAWSHVAAAVLAAARRSSVPLSTPHDGAVLQRPLPPVLRGVCLAQKPLGWPTP